MYAKAYIEITNICNMACSFCHGHSRKKERMEQKTFLHILEQLKGKTQYVYYHLMGEPLTHPELPMFLQMAADRGFKSVITTNGTLLDKVGERLLNAPLHKVNISVHSFEEGDSAAYLSKIATFAAAASQKGILISLRLWNKDHDNGRNEETEAFLRRKLPGEWQKNTRGYRIRDKLYLEYGDRFAWPDQAAPIRGEQVFCYGLRDQFGILCDGTVVPCCLDSDGVIALGNVLTQDLADILNSPRAKAMVAGFSCRRATEELCRRCGYAQRFGKSTDQKEKSRKG